MHPRKYLISQLDPQRNAVFWVFNLNLIKPRCNLVSSFGNKHVDGLTQGLCHFIFAAEQDFTQSLINEIELWKVNRYAALSDTALGLINQIDSQSQTLDEDLTNRVLCALLGTKGIQLPMASAILRFRNPKLYQVIDQRVYRIIYEGKTYQSGLVDACKGKDKIQSQISAYLQYLKQLRQVCNQLGIAFEVADRVLYMADKRINGAIKLDNY